ncbi:uncharacterized protein LOC127882141 [Dreissena polymorpha]|uniref:Uncharacterized protein n=1 Tax=Dreissena polymorpha TaxID=45954 RepID=A0A9D4GPK6_DREPO|nr:uncharacterized protein LOC127882141 [Dreissena polymorpha]KAH3819045.1 hypothetical protein DPMN_120775 [Dreissena polymorpha]
MAEICLKVCQSMNQIPLRVLCILLAFLQGCVLNYYLVIHKNVHWYSWVVADIAVMLLMIVTFIISYRHLQLAKKSQRNQSPIQTGSLPLGYFSWFMYSVILATRVAIIYKDFAYKLVEEDFFGPNTLKITISMSAFVFLLLLLSHHNAESNSERKHMIAEITATVVFDVLDSIDALDIMFDEEAIKDFPGHFDTAILIIACVNLVLPTLPLMTLSQAHFGHKIVPRQIAMAHKMMLVFFVNMPLLGIRLVLWHGLDEDISIFPVKNLIVIFLVCHDLYEKRVEKMERREQDDPDGIEIVERLGVQSSAGEESQLRSTV